MKKDCDDIDDIRGGCLKFHYKSLFRGGKSGYGFESGGRLGKRDRWATMKILFGVSGFGLIALVGLFLTSCANYYDGQKSDHFDGKRFFNPGKPVKKGFASFLKWRFTAESQEWPDYTELVTYDHPPERVFGDELRVSFVGHATVLIQTMGLNILTDPVWAERASPVPWAGPRRVHPPGIAFEDLPPIDVVLISHNHYDHLDLTSVERLWNHSKPRIIVPLGNDLIIADHNPAIVSEPYDWGDVVRISGEVAIHVEPMHHWSARGLFDRNKALWAAFTITSPGGNIYFVGDSGYGNGDYFRAAKDKFRSFRLAILPIGAYEPRWFMAYGHMNPEEGLLTFEDLGGPQFLPIHYSMFQLTDTGYEQPLKDLRQAMTAHFVEEGVIVPLMAGESWDVP
jgi:L-ascorbate metabolism protein UlaG (beta-lactamase superfamily)